MTSHEKLNEDFANILTLEDLKNFLTECLRLAAKDRDTVAGFMLAQGLFNFKGHVSLSFLEGIGVIPDANFYFAFAFHRFMELATCHDGNAARWVAHYYLSGYCPVERDEAQYRKWLKLAAQYGDKISAAELAEL